MAQGMEQIGHLAEAIAALRLQPVAREFRPPTFKGEGDVELFISQFQDICEANDWDQQTTLIQLRSSLEGPARECGRDVTIEGIVAELRARFGVSRRQARERLARLRKLKTQTMHEFAGEIQRLVGLAYPEIPVLARSDMALDFFSLALDDPTVKRHLLAVRPVTMAEAVTAVEDFTTIEKPDPRYKPTVRAVEVSPSAGPTQNASLETLVELLTKQTELLASQGEQLRRIANQSNKDNKWRQRRESTLGEERSTSVTCYHCKEKGHIKKNCPKVRQEEGGRQGNSQRPSQ